MTALRSLRRGAIALLWIAACAPAPARAQGVLSALQTDVDQIARRARPSVVTVLAQSAPIAAPGGVPGQRLHLRVGSGVAVEESIVLTTASVVLGSDRILIRTANGLQVEAELAGMAPIFNIAILQVPDLRLPPLRFADSELPQIGDWVVALGSSFRAAPTQSVGNVAYLYHEPRVPMIQITNLVYPGNSGGAAINPRGELVGIVQGELGAPDFEIRGPESERRPSGLSLVLPAGAIRPAYESLRREGRVRHGYLGVTTRAASVTSEGDAAVRVPLGALVEAVVPAGPALKLGLRHGDLIVGFDGDRVEYPEQLARWVAQTPPGRTVDLVWVRNEMRQSGRVALGESAGTLPEWAQSLGAAPRTGAASSRIGQLEQQIRQLHRELGRLRGQSSSVLR